MPHCCDGCIWGNGIDEDGLPIPNGWPKGTCKTCGATTDNTKTTAHPHREVPRTDYPKSVQRSRRNSTSSRAPSRPAALSHDLSGQGAPVLPDQKSASSQRVTPSRRGSISSQISTTPPSELNYSASDYSSMVGSQVSYLSGHQYPTPGAPASSVASDRPSSMLSMLSTRQAHVGSYVAPSVESSISGMTEVEDRRNKRVAGSGSQDMPSRSSSRSRHEAVQETSRADDVPHADSRARGSLSSHHQRSASMSGSSATVTNDWDPTHILKVRHMAGSAGKTSQHEPKYHEPISTAASDYSSHQAQQRVRRSSVSSSHTSNNGRPSLAASPSAQASVNGGQHGRRPSISSAHTGSESMHSAVSSTVHPPSTEPKRERRRSISSMHSARHSMQSFASSSRATSAYYGAQYPGGNPADVGRGVAPSPYVPSTQDARRFSYNGTVPAPGNPAEPPFVETTRRAPTPGQQDRTGYSFPQRSLPSGSATYTNRQHNSQTVNGSSHDSRSSTPAQGYGSGLVRTPSQEHYTHFPAYQEHAQPAPPAQSITAESVLSHLASQQGASAADGSGRLAEGMATMNIKMANGTEVKIVEGTKGGKGRRMSFVIEG